MLQWQPIDTAPREGAFQAWFVDKEGHEWWEPDCVRRDDGVILRYEHDWGYEEFSILGEIATHWMPKPSKPA